MGCPWKIRCYVISLTVCPGKEIVPGLGFSRIEWQCLQKFFQQAEARFCFSFGDESLDRTDEIVYPVAFAEGVVGLYFVAGQTGAFHQTVPLADERNVFLLCGLEMEMVGG